MKFIVFSEFYLIHLKKYLGIPTWRQLDPGPFCIRIVGDDCCVVAWCTGNTATISGLFFQVRYNGTFGHAADGHHISDGQLGFLTAVDKLTSVHAFSGNKKFLADLITIRVPKKITLLILRFLKKLLKRFEKFTKKSYLHVPMNFDNLNKIKYK